MTALWGLVRPHLFWVILVSVGLFAFREWLVDHDARLRAEVQVRDLQTNIDTLKAQIATKQTDVHKQVQVVVKEVQAAKTPQQQIAEIPKLTTQPLNPQALPDAPSAVKVELEPLVAQLAQCKQDAIKLGGCQGELALREQIETEQSKQVTILKKKPSFWHRLTSDSKKLAIGVAIGATGVLIARGIH